MVDLYKKVMELDDMEVERLEREEEALLKSLHAVKRHEFDNVAIGEDKVVYALEELCEGDEVIIDGMPFDKVNAHVKRGERIKLTVNK